MGKIVRPDFEKNPKNPQKWLFLAQKNSYKKNTIFFENPAVSLFLHFGPLTSCRKAKKSLEPFPRKTGY